MVPVHSLAPVVHLRCLEEEGSRRSDQHKSLFSMSPISKHKQKKKIVDFDWSRRCPSKYVIIPIVTAYLKKKKCVAFQLMEVFCKETLIQFIYTAVTHYVTEINTDTESNETR